MENQNEQQVNSENQQQSILPAQLPNSTTVLVLGIISIITCWCWGVIGLTLGIIALVLASKDLKLYRKNPTNYTEASFKNMTAGKICAIIGTVLSGIYFLFSIVYLLIVGAAVGGAFHLMPWKAWF